MRRRWWLSTVFVCGLRCWLTAQTGARVRDSTASREVRLLVGDQIVLEPGFAVGDISVANPTIADYRVRPGRRAILLLGVGSGRTKLILLASGQQDAQPKFELIVETPRGGRSRKQAARPAARFSVGQGRAGWQRARRLGHRQRARRPGADRANGAVGRGGIVRAVHGAGANARPWRWRSGAPPGPAARTAGGTSPGCRQRPCRPGAGAIEIEYDVQVIETSVTFGTSSLRNRHRTERPRAAHGQGARAARRQRRDVRSRQEPSRRRTSRFRRTSWRPAASA